MVETGLSKGEAQAKARRMINDDLTEQMNMTKELDRKFYESKQTDTGEVVEPLGKVVPDKATASTIPADGIPGSRGAQGILNMPEPYIKEHVIPEKWERYGPAAYGEEPIAPKPTRPRVPQSFPEGRPISATDVAQAIADKMGFELRHKSMPEDTLGFYINMVDQVSNGVIHSHDLNALGTIMHETGHFTHRYLRYKAAKKAAEAPPAYVDPTAGKVFWTGVYGVRLDIRKMADLPEPARAELAEVYQKRWSAGTYDDSHMYSEGFAEFFAEATLRGIPKKTMPEMSKWCINELASDPVLLENFEYARNLLERYSSQDAITKAAAEMTQNPKMPWQERLKGFTTEDAFEFLREKLYSK